MENDLQRANDRILALRHLLDEATSKLAILYAELIGTKRRIEELEKKPAGDGVAFGAVEPVTAPPS